MPPQAWTGEDMLAAFVAAGGVFENARLGVGANGRGVFAVDPSRPARVKVPSELLAARDDLILADGEVRLAPGCTLSEPARRFVTRYYGSYCWSEETAREAAEHLANFAALAPEIHALLSRDLGLVWHFRYLEGLTPFDRFKATRSIGARGRAVMMPVADLVNHAPDAASYAADGGFEVSGRFDNEILVRYQRGDALSLYLNWGFASREPRVFSLPMLVPCGGIALCISRSFRQPKAGAAPGAEDIRREGNIVTFAKLLLADRQRPRRPLAVFTRAMQGIEGIDVPALFARLCEQNRQALERVMAALAPYSGPVETGLRQACAYQLEALTTPSESLPAR